MTVLGRPPVGQGGGGRDTGAGELDYAEFCIRNDEFRHSICWILHEGPVQARGETAKTWERSSRLVLEMTNFALKMTDFALKMPDSALKMTDFALKMTDSALKMPDSALKMPDSALKMPDSVYSGGPTRFQTEEIRYLFDLVDEDGGESVVSLFWGCFCAVFALF